MILGQRFPRSARLREVREFEALRLVKGHYGRWFVIKGCKNRVQRARLAVRVAKRHLPLAVDRNRIRRVVKEVFRLERASLAQADYLVALVKPYREVTFKSARGEITRLLKQACDENTADHPDSRVPLRD